jgi:hypothetical protein
MNRLIRWVIAGFIGLPAAALACGQPPPSYYSNDELIHPSLHYQHATTTNLVLENRTNALVNPGPPGGSQTAGVDLMKSGLSAGDGGAVVRGWGSLSWTSMDNDGVITEYDGTTNNVFFGADVQLYDRLYLGLSLGAVTTDANSDFNAGSSRYEGVTLAPYFAFLFNNTYSIDGTFGYARNDIDLTRAGGTITGDTDSDRRFFAVNFNASYWWQNKWNLAFKLGYLYSHEDQDAFTESDATVNPSRDYKLGQYRVGVNLAYWAGSVMPYLGATYEYDATRTAVNRAVGYPPPNNDRDGFVLRAGMRLFITQQTAGQIELYSVEGRDDFDSVTVNGNIGVRF